jgi:hypothetical protein
MIVSARIHPGIGIARIGDSTGHVIGPEVNGARAPHMRDASGALKRQAARFRVYGINEKGHVVRELTSAEAKIKWKVHVANRKAAWYRFIAALDIPEAADTQCALRNATVKGQARERLVIDPGAKFIAGRSRRGDPKFQLDGGKFQGVPVSLGELRTDSKGRLLVLSGYGISASPNKEPVYKKADRDSFNNADDWYDDTSDGPVTAEVSIDGQAIPVEGAWVVVAPPDYAPDILGWRTMADLLTDLYVENGWLAKPTVVGFHADVLPILQRLSNLQWVNAGFAAMFGHGRPMDFNDPGFIDKLATPPDPFAFPPVNSDPYRELRHTLLNAFRPLTSKVHEPRLWPWIYGDAYGSFGDASPRNSLALPQLQAWILSEWAAGRFVRDQPVSIPSKLGDVPVAEQPDTLDRAALTYCLADAFHPGCELTWPMRRLSLYTSAFRIRHRADDDPEPDLGPQLNQTNALGLNGPIHAQPPGGLTRWMALPWQGDTAFCRSGYQPEYDPYLPTFWPARVPNQVLTEADYQIAIDPAQSREARVDAFNRREKWLRAIDRADGAQAMEQAVEHFSWLGVIETRPGVRSDDELADELPSDMLVENVPPQATAGLPVTTAAFATLPPAVDPVTRAGWSSVEQLEAFRSVRIRDQ